MAAICKTCGDALFTDMPAIDMPGDGLPLPPPCPAHWAEAELILNAPANKASANQENLIGCSTSGVPVPSPLGNRTAMERRAQLAVGDCSPAVNLAGLRSVVAYLF